MCKDCTRFACLPDNWTANHSASSSGSSDTSDSDNDTDSEDEALDLNRDNTKNTDLPKYYNSH